MSIVVMGAVFVDIKGYPLSSYIPGGRNAGRVVQVHGGVSRNIVEDIANVELRPTFVSLVDDTSAGADVVKKLQSHKVDTRYIRTTPDGMGTWLAIFDNTGDVTASISKRPDLSPIADILDEQGDEIFSQADSILLEIDMEKDIVKRTFALAEKHRKPVYAVVSNMSIAIERRDFLRSVHCFICNQQEAGILFSENYDGLSPDEMLPILRDKIRGAQIRRMVVTMGAQGAVFATLDGEDGYCPAKKVDVKDRRGRRIFRRRGHRPDLQQNDDGILRDRHAPCRVRHHDGRKRLPALPAERIRAGCFRARRRAARARALIPAPIKYSKKRGTLTRPSLFVPFFTFRTAARGSRPQGAAPRRGPRRRQSGTHTALSS